MYIQPHRRRHGEPLHNTDAERFLQKVRARRLELVVAGPAPLSVADRPAPLPQVKKPAARSVPDGYPSPYEYIQSRRRRIERFAYNMRLHPTSFEKILCGRLRTLGAVFEEQVVIGWYIADVLLIRQRIIIEVDGNHHYSEHGMRRDKARTEWLKNTGFRVCRFANQYIDPLRLQAIVVSPISDEVDCFEHIAEVNLQRDCKAIDAYIADSHKEVRDNAPDYLDMEMDEIEREFDYALFYDRS